LILGARCIEVYIAAAESLKFIGETVASTTYYLKLWQGVHGYKEGGPPPPSLSCANDPRLFVGTGSSYLEDTLSTKLTLTTILKLRHDIDQLRYSMREAGLGLTLNLTLTLIEVHHERSWTRPE